MNNEKYKKLETIFSIEFNDLYLQGVKSYDVIIPILNTNSLFRQNLLSIYKYISVNRLIVGNAGSTDNSLAVLEDFPRVFLVDHSNYRTSGVCVADLIKRVETDHFFYIHSDVFIPNRECTSVIEGMSDQAEWLEGFREHLIIVENTPNHYFTDERSYSGVQFGKTHILQKSVSVINDGDLQRNEDIVIAELVKQNGGRFLKVRESKHIHQIMEKDGVHEPKILDIVIHKEKNFDWEVNNLKIQVRGIVKHTKPSPYLIKEVRESILGLRLKKAAGSFNAELKSLKACYPVWADSLNIRLQPTEVLRYTYRFIYFAVKSYLKKIRKI